MSAAKKFDRRFQVEAFATTPNACGRLSFVMQVPRRLNVERWLGRVHVVERLRGRVSLVRVAEPSDRVRELCTPPEHRLFAPVGCPRPGVKCTAGESLVFSFEVVGPLEFVGGVCFEPLSGSVVWFPNERGT